MQDEILNGRYTQVLDYESDDSECELEITKRCYKLNLHKKALSSILEQKEFVIHYSVNYRAMLNASRDIDFEPAQTKLSRLCDQVVDVDNNVLYYMFDVMAG